MILFKPQHVQPILLGRKTQTRRFGKKRWNVGSIHQARTRMMDAKSEFAKLKILDVFAESLQDMTSSDARAEGYMSIWEFSHVWDQINGKGSWKTNPTVWVVCFRLVKETETT